ncbi:MAG: S9 family peptidase [candidate division Zixibacteria bacterium]|nr:S9 family peptidase [candidate division Zixibacteria bacterium]
MSFKTELVAMMAVLALCSATPAQDTEPINKLLEDIDQWVTTDTARIMAYIDTNNAATKEYLEASKYWEPVRKDLSFLLGIDYIGSPQIDNTGRLYFLMRITGESQALFYTDGPMGWPHQMTPNSWTDEGFTISSYSVHPSGDFTLVSVNKFGDEMHDIWYFTRDGQFRPLLESRSVRFAGVIFDDDNADQFYLYIDDRSEMRIGRYTISTETLDTLYFEEGAYYPTDYREGKLLFVRWKSFSENQLAMFDIATGAITDLSDITLIWGASFRQDGQVLVLTSTKSKDDEFMKFCVLDPSKPKEFKVLHDPGKETEDFLLIRKKGIAVIGLNNDGYSELAAFDMDGNPVDVPQPDIGVAGELSANDVGDVVFSFSSPKVSPTAFQFRPGDTEVSQLGTISTFGFDFSDIDVEVIRYRSEDGWEIPALLYTPKGAKKDGSNPAIVNYHGGPPGQSRPYFQRNIAFALSKGFVVMFPNVRGSTGYGPAYERADNLEGRFASLIDCERALDYLIEEGWSSPDKIAVWGASYGGYVVNWLASQAADKLACVVSIVGVSDVDHTNRNSSQVFAKGWEKEYGPVGSDLTRKLSPIFYADAVTRPILITAGYNDPRVPPSDPRRFAYVLSKLDKPVWYLEEIEAGHGSTFKAQLINDYAGYYVFTMTHLMK